MTGFSASRFGGTGGGSASFGSLTGDPTDNAALTAALDALLSLSGGQMSGPLSFSGTTHAGLTLNNLTTTQRNAIASPTAGMTVWNTTTARMNVYNGSAWTAGMVRLEGDTMTGALAIGNGTLTASAPVLDLSQTWNNAAVTFTGLRFNITDTASAAASNLLDIQVGGTSAAYIPKRVNGGGTGGGILFRNGAGVIAGLRMRDVALQFMADGNECGEVYQSGWRIGARALEFGAGTISPDLFLLRDGAANTLAQRNSTNAQTLRIYGTFTDASNHRRINLSMSTAGIAVLRAEGAGTGASGNVLHISSLPTANPGPGILWNNAGTPAIGT